MEEVRNRKCISEWLAYRNIIEKHRVRTVRTDVQQILDILSQLRVIKRVRILGATYYCTPDVDGRYIPDELRLVLETVLELAKTARGNAVGITVRSVLSRIREKTSEEPSSQLVANTLRSLLHYAGLDVVDGRHFELARKRRRRGTVYIYHRQQLLETICRLLDHGVNHEEQKTRNMKDELAKIIKKILRQN